MTKKVFEKYTVACLVKHFPKPLWAKTPTFEQ